MDGMLILLANATLIMIYLNNKHIYIYEYIYIYKYIIFHRKKSGGRISTKNPIGIKKCWSPGRPSYADA